MRILTAILALTIGMAMVMATDSSEPSRRKARYYYMQGSQEIARKEMASAYEYFKKAYELDTTYNDAAFTYANQRLFLRTDTMQSDTELLKSLGMMQKYVDANPLDLYAARMYGYVTSALDTLDEAIRVYERSYNLMPGETSLLEALAEAYMRQQKQTEALDALERFEKIEGLSKDLGLKKIGYYLAFQDTIGALNEANKIVAANPRDPYSLILKGNLYEVVGEMDSVYAAFKKAEELAPSNGSVKMSLASYYQTVGDTIMLDNMIYEGLLSEDFEMEDKLMILADFLQTLIDEKGDHKRGDYLFSVLLQQYPHEPDVLDMAARYSAAKGNYAEARENVSYAIDLDPTNERYRVMILSYDIQEENYKRGIEDYNEAKKHLEPSSTLKSLYAACATMLENTREGEKIITDLIRETDERLDSASADREVLTEVRKEVLYDDLIWLGTLYTSLGDLYYKQGDKDKSFEMFENALFFNNDNALTLNNYAYFLSEEDRDLDKALAMSFKAMEMSEDNPTYLDTYAWILYKMGNYKEALEYMERALELAKEFEDDNEEYDLHYQAIKKALEKAETDQ